MQFKTFIALCLTALCSVVHAQTVTTQVTEETAQAPVTEETTQVPVAATGSVARGVFTSAVQNREPTDNLTSADTNTGTLYFFTELKDMQGQTALHRWSHAGEQKAEVSFNVGSARWRVWSTKQILPEWTGTWTVDVLDGNGNVLSTSTLEYSTAAAPAVEAAVEPVTEATPQ